MLASLVCCPTRPLLCCCCNGCFFFSSRPPCVHPVCNLWACERRTTARASLPVSCSPRLSHPPSNARASRRPAAPESISHIITKNRPDSLSRSFAPREPNERNGGSWRRRRRWCQWRRRRHQQYRWRWSRRWTRFGQYLVTPSPTSRGFCVLVSHTFFFWSWRRACVEATMLIKDADLRTTCCETLTQFL